nr:uncharacterized protein LOC127333872 [Lolium perenne]
MGPRPATHQAFYAAPQPAPPTPPPPEHGLVGPALLQSVPSAGAYGGGGDWFMDTGASAHMAAHPEFDAFGFSVKDGRTRMLLHRCDSPGDLYPVGSASTTASSPLALSAGVNLWNARLGHPSSATLRQITQGFSFTLMFGPRLFENDRTRSTATEWDEGEYRKALAKITTATFTSFEDGLQPYTEDTPAPQRWQKIADHLPPLAGKEPPEMTEGEEEEVDEEEERTESESEARDFIRLPRGSKRGAESSSQGAAEEEATSRPEDKAEPSKEGAEPLSKRLRPTLLEGSMRLQRPLKDAIDAGARAGPGVRAIPTVK